jgi:hypothetical protein
VQRDLNKINSESVPKLIPKCFKYNHVIGVRYLHYEEEIELITLEVYLDEHKKYDIINIDKKFNFCPICGEQIIWD